MECELCGSSSFDTIVILPIRQNNGNLFIIACLKCAKGSSVYCKKHNRPHLGFIDNSTACIPCIEEIAAEREYEGLIVLVLLRKRLPSEEFNHLFQVAEAARAVTKSSGCVCIMRFLVAKALRTNQDILEIVKEIIDRKSVASIL